MRKRYIKSLCESCYHAYGHDCFFTPIEKRLWVQEVITQVVFAHTQRYRVVYSVTKCERYVQGRQPLLGVEGGIAYGSGISL